MRAFEQHVAARADLVVQEARSVPHKRANLLSQHQVLLDQGVYIRERSTVPGQRARHMVHVALHVASKSLWPQKVFNPDTGTRGFALISRANPSTSRTDGARFLFAQAVKLTMIWERQVSPASDH